MISMDHGPSWLLIIRSSDHRRWAVLTCRWPSLCWTAPPVGPWPLKASCFPTTCCLMGMVRDGIPGHSGEHAGHASLIELLYRAPRFFEGFFYFCFGGGFRWWTTCGGLEWNAVPDDRIQCAKTTWLVETGRCLCQSLADRDHSGFYIPKWFDQSKQMQDRDFTKENEMDLINVDPQNWWFWFLVNIQTSVRRSVALALVFVFLNCHASNALSCHL